MIAAVEYAGANGLRVAPQATGHNADALGSLEHVFLVDVRELQDVSIDRGARRVRAGAGVKWERVVPRLSELGAGAVADEATTVVNALDAELVDARRRSLEDSARPRSPRAGRQPCTSNAGSGRPLRTLGASRLEDQPAFGGSRSSLTRHGTTANQNAHARKSSVASVRTDR